MGAGVSVIEFLGTIPLCPCAVNSKRKTVQRATGSNCGHLVIMQPHDIPHALKECVTEMLFLRADSGAFQGCPGS